MRRLSKRQAPASIKVPNWKTVNYFDLIVPTRGNRLDGWNRAVMDGALEAGI